MKTKELNVDSSVALHSERYQLVNIYFNDIIIFDITLDAINPPDDIVVYDHKVVQCYGIIVKATLSLQLPQCSNYYYHIYIIL